MSGNITTLLLSKIFAGLTEYLESKYRGHLYSVKSFSIEPACAAVDNFLSAIYAVRISTELFPSPADVKEKGELSLQHEYNLVCKSQVIDDEGTTSSLAKYYWNIIFTKEKMVYSDLLESLQDLAKGSYILSPKMHHYFSEGEDYSCIILDNLVTMDYYIPKTLDEGLSLEECKLIIKNLARLHALSLVLEGRDGCTLPLKYEICTTELLFSSGVEPACKPVTYNSFLGFLKLTENFRPDLYPHLKRIDDDENVWNRLCEAVKPGKSSFSCFCHGDPRLNNIFIEKNHSAKKKGNDNGDFHSEENGNSEGLDEPGLRFIDFQLSRYASPVTDLQYVLHMGTSRQFREEHTDILLKTYYNEFQTVLSRFPHVRLLQDEAVDSWTLEKLKEEYERFYMYGFLVSMILLPMILLRPGDIDKSMSQMTRAERSQFFGEGRIELVFNIGSKNEAMRERLFELCDEMVAKNVISTIHPNHL